MSLRPLQRWFLISLWALHMSLTPFQSPDSLQSRQCLSGALGCALPSSSSGSGLSNVDSKINNSRGLTLLGVV